MQSALAFDDALGELVVTVHGEASIAGFEHVIANIVEHPRFQPGLLILFDDTNLDFEGFTTDQVREVAGLATRIAKTLAPRAVAVVVPTPVAFGLARQWETFAEPANLNTRVFAARAEALEWLRRQAPPSGA